MTERTATCGCGAVTARATGDPVVVACHCADCQRRTGSVFGVGAYYPKEAVAITGSTNRFTRPTASGGEFRQNFCPRCGTTLFWNADNNPDLIGIAVGAFVDPQFPAPVRSVWEQTIHHWVTVGPAGLHKLRGRES
ncbi:MAG: aldehyde-activating protein [Alphaproteobacteria bacterium]|nr:aldehyde-activating protein [Alphaproteobacteria bacterium]